MMKRLILITLSVSIVLLLNGCGRRGKEVLAKIDDRIITLGEFNERIDKLPEHYQEIIKREKKKFLDDLIKEELLYREALKSNIHKDADTQEVIAEARRKILVSRLIKDRVNDKIAISEEELAQYYDEHSEDFMLPERWRASHILVDSIKEAEEVKERLTKGTLFEDIAKESSIDATSKRGGDVGYFSKGQLIPKFEEACFSLEVGEISGVVKTKFGYHIIKLTDRKSPEVQEFSSVKELIKKELEGERKRQLFEELTNNLRNRTKITINEKLLEEIKETETAKEEEGK